MDIKIVLIVLIALCSTKNIALAEPYSVLGELYPAYTGVKSAAVAKEVEYRNSSTAPGDKGRYFILEVKKKGKIYEVLTKRIGQSGTNWTRVEIDCMKRRMRTMAEADDDISTMRVVNRQNWYELVDGSSKSDLFNFVCKNYKNLK